MAKPSLIWKIEVSVASQGPSAAADEAASIAVIRGGSTALLAWLETQLGLLSKPVSDAARTLQYAARLDQAKLKLCAKSLSTDRWGTTDALLERRDDLLISGWDGKAHADLPPLSRELAQAEKVDSPLYEGAAERLAAVEAALDAGQILPPHEIVLRDGPKPWPTVWKRIFKRLNIVAAPGKVEPHGPKGSALLAAQSLVGKGSAKLDKTLVWWSCGSDIAAVEAVAAGLADLGKEAADTVILCEDPPLAALLDARLRRRGAPGMGSSLSSSAHPILQVLPLALGVRWKPVNPELLLDFLTLPVGPIPRRIARDLAEAVAKQPGIAGRMWNEVIAKHTDEKVDLTGDIKERLDAWLTPSVDRAVGMMPKELMARCALVAKWAQGYARHIEKEDAASVLIDPLKTLAGQAAALSELAAGMREPISEPQLGKLVAAVREPGASLVNLPPAAGGPRWITSLAEIWAPCKRLVWLGAHTSDVSSSKWSVHETAVLKKAGIEVDHTEASLSAKRDAERAGLRLVTEQLLVIELSAHSEVRFHPVWIQARQSFEARKPSRLEDLLKTGDACAWPLKTAERKLLHAAKKPLIWKVSPELLRDRDKISPSEIDSRLGCPLKWTLEYGAKLRHSSVAGIPETITLKGTFSHRILEVVFGGSAPPKTPAEVQKRVMAACADLLPTEGAPLAQPGAARERHELELELVRAALIFFNAVIKGGYKIVGFEYAPKGKLLGKDFGGRLDVLLERSGSKAVLDMKYPGSKYRGYLEDGTATQLAVYAASVATGKNGEIEKGTAVGYLLIQRGSLLTPEGSPLAGAEGEQIVPGGPSVQQTWIKLEAALKAADGWMKSGDIPVRPLQNEEDRPKGSEMALKISDWDKDYEVCRYCSYKTLCGKSELS